MGYDVIKIRYRGGLVKQYEQRMNYGQKYLLALCTQWKLYAKPGRKEGNNG